MPDIGDLGLAEGLLTAREYRIAWPYLRQHVRHCPLAQEVENIDPNPTQYSYDGHADVVIAASPDLTFDTGDGPVWWETKSTDFELPTDQMAVLETFMATALDLVLLAEISTEITGEPVGTVKVEVLRADDSYVFPFNAADAATVAAARRMVADAAYTWSGDTIYLPRVTRACRWCDVRRWCEHRNGNDEPPPAGRDVSNSDESAADDPF